MLKGLFLIGLAMLLFVMLLHASGICGHRTPGAILAADGEPYPELIFRDGGEMDTTVGSNLPPARHALSERGEERERRGLGMRRCLIAFANFFAHLSMKGFEIA